MNAVNQHPTRHRRLPDAVFFWLSPRTVSKGRLFLAASGWITMLGVALLPAGSPPRTMLVFGFVLTCPGLAVCGLLPARETAELWVLAIALSVSLALGISVALTVLRIDLVPLHLGFLALITTVSVFVDLSQKARPEDCRKARPEDLRGEPCDFGA